MAIPASFIDELRNRITLSEVVGRKVTWDRKKTNQRKRDYWACCPFHGEKSPSFHVEDSKGRYYCFGCHASGDVVKWMMEAEGLPFREAVQQLADLAGLDVPQESPEERQRQEKKKTLVDALEIAAKWYEQSLAAPDLGQEARRYLKDARQLSPETIRKFRLGFAPKDGELFLKAMERNGLTMALLQEAGLMTRPDPEDDRKPVPYFRGRIMFPILDPSGKVIAFGGRDLSGRAKAKYLNSPETPAFSKSHTLYNFQAARSASRKAGTIIVSEGYMDVIAFDRGGFDYAVAPLGTALTEGQLTMLWRTVAEPVLAFDGDKAGQKAAYRSADLALANLQPGRSLRFAFLPEGKDPDDLLNAGGRQALNDILAKPAPLVDVLWRGLKEGADLATPEAKAGFEAECREKVALIKDPAVRAHYADAVEEKIKAEFGRSTGMHMDSAPTPQSGGGRGSGSGGGRSFDEREPWQAKGVRTKWVKQGRRRVPMEVGASDVVRRSALVSGQIEGRPQEAARGLRDKRLLGLLLAWPEAAEIYLEELAEIHLMDPALDRLYAATLDKLSQTPGLDSAGLLRNLTNQGYLDDFQRLDGTADVSARADQGRFSVAKAEDEADASRQMGALIAQMRVLAARNAVKEATASFEQDGSEQAYDRLVMAKKALEVAERQAQHDD